MDLIARVAKALEGVPVRDTSAPGSELDQLRLREAARAAIKAVGEAIEEYDDAETQSSWGWFLGSHGLR